MDAFSLQDHLQLPAWVLLFGSAAYTSVLLAVGTFIAFRKRVKHPGIWLGLGLIGWIPVLLLGGQHLPLIDALTPGRYCFGAPGLEHGIALSLPPLAAIWLAIAARREDNGAAGTVV